MGVGLQEQIYFQSTIQCCVGDRFERHGGNHSIVFKWTHMVVNENVVLRFWSTSID